jgi:hypothetical protein
MSLYNENDALPPEEFSPEDFPPEPEPYIPESAPLQPAHPVADVVAPPVERPVIIEEPMRPADRSTMSQATMLFGLAALSLSMLGGTFFVLDAFQNGLGSLMGILVKAIPVVLAYIVGWTLCLWSIRSFSNLVLPFLIKYYLWVTLTGLVILYIKIMQKLFEQTYDLPHFFSYNMMIAAGLVALIGLHLLLDQPNMRRYSIPIIMACTWHLILMVIRFVVLDLGNPIYLLGDLYFFIVMFGLAALMLAHWGILNPLRNLVNAFFQPVESKEAVG